MDSECTTKPPHSCLRLLEQRASPAAILTRFEEEYNTQIEFGQEKFTQLLNQCLEYPPPTRWLRTLTKFIVNRIEMTTEACSDELVELAINCSLKKSKALKYDADELDNEAYYTIYDLERKKIAIRTMRMHNEVGTKLWTAGMLLSELCMMNSRMFENATVVELGAGVGVTGLCLALCDKPPQRIILTDYAGEAICQDTINNLKHNVSLNLGDSSIINVRELDWAKCTSESEITSRLGINTRDIDVLLAADCAYSLDLCEQLVTAIKNILRAATVNRTPPTLVHDISGTLPVIPSAEQYPFAIIATTVREVDTFDHLMRVIDRSGLICTDVSDWADEQTKLGNSFVMKRNKAKDQIPDVVRVHFLCYSESI